MDLYAIDFLALVIDVARAATSVAWEHHRPALIEVPVTHKLIHSGWRNPFHTFEKNALLARLNAQREISADRGAITTRRAEPS